MIPFYSSASVSSADRTAIETLGLPSEVLMESAGKGAAEALLKLYGKTGWTLLCGTGKNGGDGFVLARHLLVAGCEVTVVLAAEKGRVRGENALFLRAFENLGGKVIESPKTDDDSLRRIACGSSGIIDALLGTGSEGQPRGECGRLLSLLVLGRMPRVALDIPSGVNPSTGETWPNAFRADLTLTFLAPKIGLRVMPGAACAGKVEIVPIGVTPDKVLPSGELEGYTREDAAKDWPFPAFDDNKSRKGTVLILGGCKQYRGAPLLAARAALRAGAGLVVIVVPECIAEAASLSLPETVIARASNGDPCTLDPEIAIQHLSEWREKACTLVAGPGLGRSNASGDLVDWISREWTNPVVLDGDALFFLSGRVKTALSLITPHEGEAARMIGKTAQQVSAFRLRSVSQLFSLYGPALLKGPFSLCCDGNRTGFSLESTPALAVPGSGDVLAGIAGLLLSRRLSPYKAGLAAAWIHARSARHLSLGWASETGLLAGEVADAIPVVLGELLSPTAPLVSGIALQHPLSEKAD